VTITIVGDSVDVLDASCAIEGRPAYEVIGGWVTAELARVAATPTAARRVRSNRRHRGQVPQLYAVE
jgi:hypothetical protein